MRLSLLTALRFLAIAVTLTLTSAVAVSDNSNSSRGDSCRVSPSMATDLDEVSHGGGFERMRLSLQP